MRAKVEKLIYTILNTYKTMKKQNKYNYLLTIQQYFGQWEDVSQYEANSSGYCKERTEKEVINTKTGKPMKRSLSNCSIEVKEYQLMGYPTRVIFRKELNKNH